MQGHLQLVVSNSGNSYLPALPEVTEVTLKVIASASMNSYKHLMR